MGEWMSSFGVGIMMVFYLYLLARWQHVRRPFLYLLGSAGLLVGMMGSFFSRFLPAFAQIVGTIGVMVSFAAAVGACYGAELPINLPAEFTGAAQPPPQASQPPASTNPPPPKP